MHGSLADAESDDTDGDGTCTEHGLLAQYTVSRFDTSLPIQSPARNASVNLETSRVMIVHNNTSCLVTIHDNTTLIPPDHPAHVNALLLIEATLPVTVGVIRRTEPSYTDGQDKVKLVAVGRRRISCSCRAAHVHTRPCTYVPREGRRCRAW